MRFLLVAVVLLVAVSPVRADKEAARAAYIEATKHYDLNEFQTALDLFRKAYLEFEDPVLLYNMAQCYRQLAQKGEALKFYRSYLRKVPDAPNTNEVRAIIARLDGEIAQEKTTASAPPVGTIAPQVVPSPAPPELVASVVQAEESRTSNTDHKKTPVYKRWWLWTVVGVVAAGAAVGIAVGVTHSSATEQSLNAIHVTQ